MQEGQRDFNELFTGVIWNSEKFAGGVDFYPTFTAHIYDNGET